MKVQLQKYNFLSTQQQKVIFLAYNNGLRINYKEQRIFKNEQSFLRAMKNLCKSNVFRRIKNNDYYDEFILIQFGKFLVRSGLIPLSDRNE